jgi:undecaprenyl diphosphate synthase
MSEDSSTSSAKKPNLPRHIAIIMDGNGRWAKNRLMPRFAGHKAGVEAVRSVVENCARKGVEVLTLFAFSSENWRRPAKEVGLLMDLLHSALGREKLQSRLRDGEQETRDNTGLTLVVALNYGGMWDIAHAARLIASRVKDGQVDVQDVDEEMFATYLSVSDLPNPDLFIRTGGEMRISNFLLWQLAYTELYFTETLWPDFNEQTLNEALASFARRQRRFGRTSEQVEQEQGA